VLRFNPEDPDQSRLLRAVGCHASMLYSMLHLACVEAVKPKGEVVGEPAVTLDDSKCFRQLDNKCPGHPE